MSTELQDTEAPTEVAPLVRDCPYCLGDKEKDDNYVYYHTFLHRCPACYGLEYIPNKAGMELLMIGDFDKLSKWNSANDWAVAEIGG